MTKTGAVSILASAAMAVGGCYVVLTVCATLLIVALIVALGARWYSGLPPRRRDGAREFLEIILRRSERSHQRRGHLP